MKVRVQVRLPVPVTQLSEGAAEIGTQAPSTLPLPPSTVSYRLQLPLLENPGQKATPQRHREQQQEGKGERGCRGLDHPEQCDAAQLDAGEQVHPPRLHLGTGVRSHHTPAHTSGELAPQVPIYLPSHPILSIGDPLDILTITQLPRPCFLAVPWSHRAARDGVLLA